MAKNWHSFVIYLPDKILDVLRLCKNVLNSLTSKFERCCKVVKNNVRESFLYTTGEFTHLVIWIMLYSCDMIIKGRILHYLKL